MYVKVENIVSTLASFIWVYFQHKVKKHMHLRGNSKSLGDTLQYPQVKQQTIQDETGTVTKTKNMGTEY